MIMFLRNKYLCSVIHWSGRNIYILSYSLLFLFSNEYLCPGSSLVDHIKVIFKNRIRERGVDEIYILFQSFIFHSE